MIVIKEMEMPKSCLECLLAYPRWDFNIGCKCCKAIIGHHDEYGEYKTKRHPDCPLVEIITCKDCKHWHDDGIMTTCDKNIGHGFPRDHFCADAERRE